MGMREKIVTVTKLVPFCDVCGKDCPVTHQHSCFVCGRSGGYCCISGRQLGPADGKLLELFVNVCKDCEAANVEVCGERFSFLILQKIGQADADVSGLLERWKVWSKERRERRGTRSD